MTISVYTSKCYTIDYRASCLLFTNINRGHKAQANGEFEESLYWTYFTNSIMRGKGYFFALKVSMNLKSSIL